MPDNPRLSRLQMAREYFYSVGLVAAFALLVLLIDEAFGAPLSPVRWFVDAIEQVVPLSDLARRVLRFFIVFVLLILGQRALKLGLRKVQLRDDEPLG